MHTLLNRTASIFRGRGKVKVLVETSVRCMLAGGIVAIPVSISAQVGVGPAPSLAALYGANTTVVRQQFDYTGSQVSATAPAHAIGVYFKVWGAGGGHEIVSDDAKAGAGGYTGAVFNTSAGTQYALVVGAGGNRALRPDSGAPPAQPTQEGVFGFGGLSTHDQGGGLSGVFSGTAAVTATSQARALAVAGGGGGSDNDGNGNRAGGTNGNGPLSGEGSNPGTLTWNYAAGTTGRSPGTSTTGSMQGSNDGITNPADGTGCLNIQFPAVWQSSGGGGYQGGGRTQYTPGSDPTPNSPCGIPAQSSGRGGSGFAAPGNRFQSIEFTNEIAQADNAVVNVAPRSSTSANPDTDHSAAGGRAVPIGQAGNRSNFAYSANVNGGGDGRIVAYWIIAAPTVKVQKTTVAGTGGPFTFSGTNLAGTPAAITTTAANTPTPAGASPILVSAPGTAVSITETVASGYAQTGVVCNDANSALTGNTNPVATATTGAVTIGAAVTATAADITCVFTNTRQPILRLQKALPTGRFVAADQFTLSIAGAGGPAAVTTSGTSNAPLEVASLSPATIDSPYTLSEAGASGAALSNYATAYACTNALAGGQTPSGSGSSFSVTPAAGDDLTCTLSNSRLPNADLAVVKTASPASVQTGGILTYTLTVRNNGPDTANSAVLRDTPGAGLDCTLPDPTATCAASGGAACSGPTLSVASLTSPAGAPIPTLPPGGAVVVTFQCKVTASGS